MRKKLRYGLVWGLAGLLVLVLGASTALAQCSIWYDQRHCGDGPIEYEGEVLYQFEMLEAPISVASGNGWYPGHLYADLERLAYADNYGHTVEAEYNSDTGCYENWSGEMGTVIQAFCANGDVVNYWYAYIHWTGFGSEFRGPWLYHVTIAPPQVAAEQRMRRLQVGTATQVRPSTGRRVAPGQ